VKGLRIKWTRAQLAFVKRRRKWPRLQLHAAFVKRFRRRDVSFDHLRSLCVRRGWTGASRAELGQRMRGRSRAYSKTELAWIKSREKIPRRQLHAEFVKTFGRSDLTLHNFKQLCKRQGLLTGRTGRFEKGIVPANKGKKMPFNASSARTQFKKGQLPRNTKHLGHERTDKDGYVLVSVAETNPHTGYERRYVFKHRWLWEKKHGPVPKGMVLKCKGDKSDGDPSNWELISRSLLARLNHSRNRYDTAPADLKPAIMAVAKLRNRIGEKRRSTR
jgi:hypothetical protein